MREPIMCHRQNAGCTSTRFAALRVTGGEHAGKHLCSRCADELGVTPEQRCWVTTNGVEVTPGLRVLTNDWEWGTVTREQFEREHPSSTSPGGPYFDGWFGVKLDSGATHPYNGERMTTEAPLDGPKDPQS